MTRKINRNNASTDYASQVVENPKYGRVAGRLDDAQTGFISDHLDPNPMQQVHRHSITYRIAFGPQQGKKVFTLQTLLPKTAEDDRFTQVAKAGGFSLHAGVEVQPHKRKKLEHLCRNAARPALSEQLLALTRDGQVRYELKTPHQDGTTHVIFEPLDFMAKLAALVAKPRVNLTRFHGVFVPSCNCRVMITPAKRGKEARGQARSVPCTLIPTRVRPWNSASL